VASRPRAVLYILYRILYKIFIFFNVILALVNSAVFCFAKLVKSFILVCCGVFSLRNQIIMQFSQQGSKSGVFLDPHSLDFFTPEAAEISGKLINVFLSCRELRFCCAN
jgi:hypothetical protein